MPFHARTVVVLLLVPAVLPAQTGTAKYSVDCKAMKLTAAKGVPGWPDHDYALEGTCAVFPPTKTSGEFQGPVHTFPAIGKASWDLKERQYSEVIKILGTFTLENQQVGGDMQSIYDCVSDPLVTTTSCNAKANNNETNLPLLSYNFLHHKPLFSGNVTLAAATALSGDTSKPPPENTTPPPPAAKQGPTDPRAAAAGAVLDAMTSMMVLTKPVAGEVLPGSFMVEVIVGENLMKQLVPPGTAIITRQVQFEWQSANEAAGGGRLKLPTTWQPKAVNAPAGWAGRSGGGTLARATVPAGALAGFPRWRVRATIPGTSIAPSAWVEFRTAPKP
jgi:hypothetical protein